MPFYRSLAALLASGLLLPMAHAAQARALVLERQKAPESAPMSASTLRETSSPAFTPDDAAREIQRRHGGRVLAVQPDGAGYRVKMLKDGEVRIYQVNP